MTTLYGHQSKDEYSEKTIEIVQQSGRVMPSLSNMIMLNKSLEVIYKQHIFDMQNEQNLHYI